MTIDREFKTRHGYTFEPPAAGSFVVHVKHGIKVYAVHMDVFDAIEEHGVRKLGLWHATNGCIVLDFMTIGGHRRAGVYDPETCHYVHIHDFEGAPVRDEYHHAWKYKRRRRMWSAAQERFRVANWEVSE